MSYEEEINSMKFMEEELREAACYGDEETLKELIQKGVNVNSKNHINGWTALHWAACRDNVIAASILLKNGADPAALTSNGDLPCDLAKSEEMQVVLGRKISNREQPSLPITPNYLENPPFFYSVKNSSEKYSINQSEINSERVLILKVRVAEALETDFIEIELHTSELTFENLKEICCKELNIEPTTVSKIRKLPNTIVRNNRDVQRLINFQELEICQRKA